MMHPYIIDSSLAYNLTGRRNFRSSLKLLCEIFLDERIQIAGVGGHDPTEDAISTLKLIQLKLKKDEEYGNVIQGWEPPAATVQGWQQIQMRRPELEKDSTEDTKKKQSEQNNNASTEKAIGPFIRKDIYVFQKMESRNIAIITTAACLKNYLGVLASLYNTPSVEVLAGNKQVSQRAGDFVASSNLTHIHMQMGKKLSQCPDEATRQKQLRKLDKRLQRIHKAAAPKSVHIYVFSGSSLEVPFKERSNGFVLVGIKDLPFRT
ncbi:putative exonuclease C637.09 [Chionoecetes opilio]|uniref:Putative exonuclease C637.09 n=1 Tax=Chionoecetes opilio TaxID=41210 RepID=A0A8J4YHP6_CHIOP|nr:putative exonuclease C637.09 [Chionoecetes opilio]